MKNSLIVILVILLILSVGMAIYFYINSQSKIKELQAELNEAKLETQDIKEKKLALERKNAEGLAYIEYLNVVISPFLRDSGVTPRFLFDNDMKWLLEVEKRTESFNSSELNNHLDKLKSHDQRAFGLMLNWVLGKAEETLK